jgi:hypothetical protein
MIEDISEKLLREFARRLQEELTGEPAADGPQPDEPAPLAADGGAETNTSAGEPAEEAVDTAAAPAPAASAIAAETPDAEIAGQAPPSPSPESPEARPPMAPSEPLDAGSLVGSVLWDRVRKNPLPVAFLAGLLFAIALFRRRRRG